MWRGLTQRAGPKPTRRAGLPTRPDNPTAHAPSRRWLGPAGAWFRGRAESHQRRCHAPQGLSIHNSGWDAVVGRAALGQTFTLRPTNERRLLRAEADQTLT